MKGSPNRPSRFVWGRALKRLRKEPQFRSPAARMQSNSLARYGGRQRLTLQRGGDSRQTKIDHLRAHEPGRQHGNTVLNKLLKTPRTGHKPTRANYPLHSRIYALSFSCPKWHAQFQRPHNMAERRVYSPVEIGQNTWCRSQNARRSNAKTAQPPSSPCLRTQNWRNTSLTSSPSARMRAGFQTHYVLSYPILRTMLFAIVQIYAHVWTQYGLFQ